MALKNLLIAMIKAYRYLVSPWLGMHCRFTPTCSMYAIECLREYGTMRGVWLTLKRIARCHPWNEGGYDPVPVRSEEKQQR